MDWRSNETCIFKLDVLLFNNPHRTSFWECQSFVWRRECKFLIQFAFIHKIKKIILKRICIFKSPWNRFKREQLFGKWKKTTNQTISWSILMVFTYIWIKTMVTMHSIAQNRKSNMNRLDSNIKRVVKIVRGISFRVSSTRKLGSFRCYISPFRHGDFRSFF